MSTARLTLIGGPTALVEFGGFRLLTDPTFDDPGEYRLPHTTLTKTSRPACTPADIGAVDAVLLSHDQHADNLDRSGRDFLSRAPRVFTTLAGAENRMSTVSSQRRDRFIAGVSVDFDFDFDFDFDSSEFEANMEEWGEKFGRDFETHFEKNFEHNFEQTFEQSFGKSFQSGFDQVGKAVEKALKPKVQ